MTAIPYYDVINITGSRGSFPSSIDYEPDDEEADEVRREILHDLQRGDF